MTDVPNIYAVMSAAMEEVQAVRKEGYNDSQRYNFRGIDQVVNAVGPIFRKHKIIPVPHACKAEYRDVLTSTGKPSREVTVTAEYRFYGPAGDYIPAIVPGESMDTGDKGTPKAMSVAYRIVLLQMLCIPTDDTDPDAQSYERAQAAPEVDPLLIELNEAKADVKEAWEATVGEFSMAELERNYKLYTGVDLTTAGAPELRAFAQDLREGTVEASLSEQRDAQAEKAGAA